MLSSHVLNPSDKRQSGKKCGWSNVVLPSSRLPASSYISISHYPLSSSSQSDSPIPRLIPLFFTTSISLTRRAVARILDAIESEAIQVVNHLADVRGSPADLTPLNVASQLQSM